MPIRDLSPDELFGEVRKNWGWLLALGIASLVLGTIGLGSVFALTLVGVMIFGWLIVAAGLIELFQAFKGRGWKSRLWQVLIAVIHLAAGVIIIIDPLLASGLLTLFLAVAFIAGGACRSVVAFHHRDHSGWGWMLLGGILAVVLGVMIALRWPESSAFVIGLFIAIELIINGWTLVILALAARSAGRGAPHAAGEPA